MFKNAILLTGSRVFIQAELPNIYILSANRVWATEAENTVCWPAELSPTDTLQRTKTTAYNGPFNHTHTSSKTLV